MSNVSQPLTIGFVGLGAMGQHVARRLLAAGHSVQGFDIRQTSLDQLAQAGGKAVANASQVVAGARLSIMFLVNAQQLESVLFAPEGLAEQAAPGHIIMSCVTMSAGDVRRLAERCTGHGLVYVDAPVSGGVVGAESGKLSIMASGDPAALNVCAPVLEIMGSRVLRVGDQPGQGSTFKTINQMLCGVHLAVAGEAMALAERAGLDARQVLDLVGSSAASSWMLNDRGPAMIEQRYSPVNSAVDIFVKDLGVVMELARDLRFAVPISAAAMQAFLGASGAGFGQADDSAVTEYYRLVRKHNDDTAQE